MAEGLWQRGYIRGLAALILNAPIALDALATLDPGSAASVLGRPRVHVLIFESHVGSLNVDQVIVCLVELRRVQTIVPTPLLP